MNDMPLLTMNRRFALTAMAAAGVLGTLPAAAAELPRDTSATARQLVRWTTETGAQHVADADGEHDDGERGLAQDGADHCTLQHRAKQPHGQDAGEHRHPEGKAQHGHERQATESAEHHEFALGKAHGLRGFVDKHEPERNQPVDAPLRDTADQQLHKLHTGSPE